MDSKTKTIMALMLTIINNLYSEQVDVRALITVARRAVRRIITEILTGPTQKGWETVYNLDTVIGLLTQARSMTPTPPWGLPTLAYPWSSGIRFRAIRPLSLTRRRTMLPALG